MNPYRVTWSEVDDMIDDLVKKLELSGVKAVYGFPRGGLVPAVMLSHRLGVPLVDEKGIQHPDTLFVDDLTDSGQTLADFCRQFNNPKTATLFHNETSIFEPTYYSKIKPLPWIIFPWEKDQ